MRLYVRSRLCRGLGGRLVVHVADNLTRLFAWLPAIPERNGGRVQGSGAVPRPRRIPALIR